MGVVQALVFRIGCLGEPGEPVGHLGGVAAHKVAEHAETFFFNLALVERQGFDLVGPCAHGAVDGKLLRAEVELEVVPVVLGSLDVEDHLLAVVAFVDLGLEVDFDTHRLVAHGDQTHLAVVVETHGGAVLPLDIVEEQHGLHGIGESGEVARGGIEGIGGGALVGTEVVHHGVAHLGIGGDAQGREAEVLLDVVGHSRHQVGGDGEGDAEDGSEVVVGIVLDAHLGGTVGVEGSLGALEGEVHEALTLHHAVGGGHGEVGFDDGFGVGDLGFGGNHVLLLVAEISEDSMGGEELVVSHLVGGEECRLGTEILLVEEDGCRNAVALPVGGQLGDSDVDVLGVGVVGIG